MKQLSLCWLSKYYTTKQAPVIWYYPILPWLTAALKSCGWWYISHDWHSFRITTMNIQWIRPKYIGVNSLWENGRIDTSVTFRWVPSYLDIIGLTFIDGQGKIISQMSRSKNTKSPLHRMIYCLWLFCVLVSIYKSTKGYRNCHMPPTNMLRSSPSEIPFLCSPTLDTFLNSFQRSRAVFPGLKTNTEEEKNELSMSSHSTG